MDTIIETTTVGDTRIVSVEGEVDMTRAPELESTLRTHRSGPLVIDLTRCAFIDSHGLRALLAGARGRHSPVLVCSPGNPFRRLLEIAGARRLYRIVETLDEAMVVVREP